MKNEIRFGKFVLGYINGELFTGKYLRANFKGEIKTKNEKTKNEKRNSFREIRFGIY